MQFVSAAVAGTPEWDAVVNGSPDGWVFALSGWQRLILAVPRWELIDVSFAIKRDAQLIAVVPLQFQPSSRRLASSGWGLAGPVLAASLAETERREILSAALAHVEEIGAGLGAAAIEMGRSPVTTSGMGGSGENPFAALGFDDVSTQTKVLRLDATEEQLWNGLSKNARQMIKKASALGYCVRRGVWTDCVDDYYRVHSETYERTGVVPHPREYFAGIASEMGPLGHAVLWVGHAPDGRPVAFHNDARFGPGTLYHTSCSESAHLDSGINYLLMWEAILDAKRSGGRWYEVGEVFPDTADDKARGLTVFKSKFGGELRRSIKAKRLRPVVSAEPVDPTEQRLRDAFHKSAAYEPSRVSRPVNNGGDDYADRLLQERFQLAERHYRGGRMVDLCCATGSHLIDHAGQLDSAVGVDFTLRYLDVARTSARERGAGNVTFVQADARSLPLAKASVNLLYCFSSLHVIPGAAAVVSEVGRVLAPGGRAVLDFGSSRSLNAFCLRYYTEFAAPHLLTVRQIRAAIEGAGLRIVSHRRFQILPLWAGRPSWLWPLLHPWWKSVLKRRVLGRMLDEWISSAPLLRAFAFRHVIVCEKP
jgi:SAM-dependent methyltransferase